MYFGGRANWSKKCWTKPNHGTLASFIIRYRYRLLLGIDMIMILCITNFGGLSFLQPLGGYAAAELLCLKGNIIGIYEQ
jgi:hypothetical protein